MKVFVAGGSGFIGRNIVEHLSDIYAIVAPGHAELDLQNKDAVVAYFKNEKPDVVVFAVNVGGKRNQADQKILQDNLNMFFNIVAGKEYFKRMIVLGSGAEYDKRRPIVSVREDSFGESVPADEYGFGKHVMSQYTSQVDYITHLRLFGVYGKHEDYQVRFISNALCRKVLGLPIIINRNVVFDYIYIKDLVEILRKFIENKPPETCYNVGTGTPIDLYSLAQIVNRVDGNPGEIKVLNEGLNNEYTCNIERLKEYLGEYKFTSHEKAIKEMHEYYKNIKSKLNRDIFLTE